MARTASRAADSAVLRSHDTLAFQSGSLRYEVATRDGASLYSVSDGTRSSAVPLAWAFGAGKVGQTYLFEKDGTFHETRLSYFATLGAAGFTPARAIQQPRDLEEALARPIRQPELGRCFGCHTTASTTEGRFDPAVLMPGVTCEACHGPCRQHVAAAEQGHFDQARAAVFNPGKLDPVDSVDFCGACHATFWDVKLAGEAGVAALRSQPHRLQSSRCWKEGDARLTCVACHNPHRPLVREAPAYDQRCLSCHVLSGPVVSGDHPGPPCKAGKPASCATCHMPKYEVPDMHFQFTDHLIRVVEAKRPPPAAEAQADGVRSAREEPGKIR
jgi:hypothetical protein